MSKYIATDKLWNRLISVSENDWVGFDTIDEVLSGMPAADVAEVRHGRWETFSPFSKPRCSICGELCIGTHAFDYTLTNYCPNCGASMDLEGEEE